MKKLFLLFTGLLIAMSLQAQTPEQKQLESKKQALMGQIQEMIRLHSQQTQERKSITTQIEEIQQKIATRTKLIRLTNQQINLFNREINLNMKQIERLRSELKKMKEEYATIIIQSYKNSSNHNRLMFLLSSESFTQAYKRILYMKQYSEYRKKQASEIETKTNKLRETNENLISQRKQKEIILQQNKKEQQKLALEKQQQERLVNSIKKKEGEYAAEIQKKKRQATAIDREIQRIIRESIAENNKKKGNSGGSATTFAMTPEAKKMAANFQANKGNLIWPVAKGFKAQGYGTYSDPVYPDVKHMNNGVTIQTEKNAEARAVFDGEVSAIFAIPGGNTGIQIRHGNYITIYSNLAEVYVSKGEKVKMKTPLGRIHTSVDTGKTEMKFYLYKNNERLNPEYWILKM